MKQTLLFICLTSFCIVSCDKHEEVNPVITEVVDSVITEEDSIDVDSAEVNSINVDSTDVYRFYYN